MKPSNFRGICNEQTSVRMSETHFYSTPLSKLETKYIPGTAIEINHELVMMTYRVHLSGEGQKDTKPRLRSDLEKLMDQDVACTFKVAYVGKFTPMEQEPLVENLHKTCTRYKVEIVPEKI